MNYVDRVRLSPVPFVWALGWVIALGSAFYAIPWFVVAYDSLSEANHFDWPETVANAFGPDLEYRPLFHLALKASYEMFGMHLWPYQTLVLLQFACVLALVIWLCQPVGAQRAAAGCIALSCIAGLHTSRILFGFWPVNAGSIVLILLLLAIAIGVDARARSITWIYLPIVLVAMLSVEWGVMIIAVLPVLWLMRAPAVDRRALAWAFAGVAAYAAIRLVFGMVAAPPSFHTESGFGFSQLSPPQLQARFGDSPWLFRLYNVGATFLTVVASEPRDGIFGFTAALLDGNVPYWRWVHVASSLLTTVAIATGLVFFRHMSPRDRLLCGAGLALLVFGSAFGVPYTRDRVGMMAGVGYGLLLYVGLVALLARMPDAGWRRKLMIGCVTLIGVAWVVRNAEAYFQLRDTAWDYRQEWVERAAEPDAARPHDAIWTTLRTDALNSAPDDPRRDPVWTFVLFERRFPIAAAKPLSAPFDVRWKPDVTDGVRQQLETQLGLTDAQRVARDPRQRTWEYRLRRPTHNRVRAVLQNAAVEDTARIDPERFEIVD
ncbi:MAG TPA: hypothetical protein VFB92_14460 [Vicinamibacterales bacterium]|nr:hypothetical protein [Vicinamibacterales bacterium]